MEQGDAKDAGTSQAVPMTQSSAQVQSGEELREPRLKRQNQQKAMLSSGSGKLAHWETPGDVYKRDPSILEDEHKASR
jgi:hypothetical protein